MEQARAFMAESDALADLLERHHTIDWNTATQFKNWTINDVIVHLHFWNKAADLSLTDETAFTNLLIQLMAQLKSGGLRDFENGQIPQRGNELAQLWKAQYRDMATRWETIDPKRRLKWAGPDMSVRSSMTARQMETWAHGHEIFDILGEERIQTDHIKNVVIMGINTFGWSFQVRGKKPPAEMPTVRLTAPSGADWVFGEGADTITGLAHEFAQIVTQTRNIGDTGLIYSGPIASEWMENAQCFAGPPEHPPAKGSRTIARS